MSTAFWTVTCDGCGEQTDEFVDCIHGRITCWDCDLFAPCRHCKREARP